MRLNKDEQAFADLLDGLRADAPGEMAKLAHLAAALEHVRPATGPSPMFRNALRNRVIAEAAARRSWIDRVAERWAERNASLRRSFKFVFAAGVATLVLLTSGAMFMVADNSVPGDWDYWAKRLHEDARLLITRAPEQRGYLQLELARERVDEVAELVNRGQDKVGPYAIALNDMDARTMDATQLLVGVFRSTHRTAPLRRLTNFAVAQTNALEVLVDKLPPAARPYASDSLDILHSVSNRVTGIMGGCLCPANALLPKAGGSSDDNGGAGGLTAPQSPQCACSRFRSEDSTSTASGNPTEPGRKPGQPPAQPPDDSHITDVVPDVPGTQVDNDVKDVVNDLIDNTLGNTLDPVIQPVESIAPALPGL
jgi:hypothetical protein